ncbi:unnamed protein product [Sphagnum balticum]
MVHSEEAEIATLRQRVFNVENGLIEIKGLINNLAQKFDTQSRTPWVVIFTGMTAIGGILGAYINIQLVPINRELDKFEVVLEKISDKFMPSTEIDRKFEETNRSLRERLEIAGARRDDWQRISELNTSRNLNLVTKLQEEIVPRVEHEGHWREFDKELMELQRRLDGIDKAQLELFSEKALIKDDSDRIKKLEELVLGKFK